MIEVWKNPKESIKFNIEDFKTVRMVKMGFEASVEEDEVAGYSEKCRIFGLKPPPGSWIFFALVGWSFAP